MNDAEHNPDGCTNHFSDGSKIFPNRDCCDQSARIAELERELSRYRGPAINPPCPVCPSSTPDQVIFSPVYGGNRHFYCKSCEQSFAGSFTYGPSELERRVEELTEEFQACNDLCANEAGGGKVSDVLGRMFSQLRAEVETLTRERDEARAEADALRAQSKLPDDYCLACGGTGGHEEGCRGTTGMLALRAQVETLTKERDENHKMWAHWQTEATKAQGENFENNRAANVYKNAFDEAIKQRDEALVQLAASEADRARITELLAREIYEGMRKGDEEGSRYPWVPNGNSLKQTEARHKARAAIDAAREEEA